MTTPASPVRVRQHSPAYWRVTFDNPPINMYGAGVLAGLRSVVDRLEAGPGVKVVVFDSADPDFFISRIFISHIDLMRVGEAASNPDRPGCRPGPTS